jgi:hypothetical protein
MWKKKLHFVNWNSDKYNKPEDAINSNNHDGLLVLGILVKVKIFAQFE